MEIISSYEKYEKYRKMGKLLYYLFLITTIVSLVLCVISMFVLVITEDVWCCISMVLYFIFFIICWFFVDVEYSAYIDRWWIYRNDRRQKKNYHKERRKQQIEMRKFKVKLEELSKPLDEELFEI